MYDKLLGEAKHECVLDETQDISWIAIRDGGSGRGHPLSGTKETWLAPNVLAGSMTTGSADRSEIGQIDRNRRRRGCAGARDTNSAPPRLTTPLL